MNTTPLRGTSPFHDEVMRFRMTRVERVVKRAFDILFAGLGLLLLSPLYLLLMVVLMIGGNGRVFYRQERLGRHGRPFSILKFRTMKADAEADVPKLEMPGDPRLTRIGRYLRRHHLDELPQLWNVLKGDMSVVGPRPERPYFVEQIQQRDARYAYLFQLRPGLTSEATLRNGYANNLDKMLTRLDIDLLYLHGATLWGDIRCILQTAALVARGEKVASRSARSIPLPGKEAAPAAASKEKAARHTLETPTERECCHSSMI